MCLRSAVLGCTPVTGFENSGTLSAIQHKAFDESIQQACTQRATEVSTASGPESPEPAHSMTSPSQHSLSAPMAIYLFTAVRHLLLPWPRKWLSDGALSPSRKLQSLCPSALLNAPLVFWKKPSAECFSARVVACDRRRQPQDCVHPWLLHLQWPAP